MKLYEITNNYIELMERLENNDDPGMLDTLKDTLDSIEGDFEDKVNNCCKMYQNILADAEAFGAEAKRLTDKKRAAENKADRLKEYVQSEMKRMGKTSAYIGTFKLGFRNTKAVKVEDFDRLPEEYIRVKKEPDKKAIKAALDAGVTVDGASIVENESFSIR